MQLSAVLASPFVLPSIPRVVALLLSELEREEADLKKITQLISQDPALTIRLMQLSNSGYFRMSGRVNSVSECLAIVGLSHVRTMTNASATKASLRAVVGINLQQYWSYSLDVAKVSRSLAGVVRQNQQAAFTAGMIHYVGEIVLRLLMPTEMARLDSDLPALDARRAKAERRLFGFNYAEVGAGLARQWLFPEPIIDALACQDTPFLDNAYEPLAGVLHLAAWRGRSKDAGLNQREMAVTFPGSVGDVLSLDIDMVLQQDPIDWSSPRSR
ncbi:MAG: HDOD domain-containing protein [Rhodoferax sp.]|jgi:HD-like signal output (HDOD) protein|nr:HDOD domain-containing protein [Rhodoferax sp.]